MSETFDYTKCAYNIEGIPDTESCIEKFPDLMNFSHILMAEDDLPEGVSADKVLRYLILMFSPGTPAREASTDIGRRKQWVLNKLNIQADENGNHPDGYGEMCLMNKAWIANRFITFTHLFSSDDYSVVATAEIRMAKYQKKILLAEIDKATDEGHYVANLEKWREAKEKALTRIMQGEESKRLQEAITFSIKTDSLGLMPEEFTVVWRDGKDLFADVTP